MASADTAAAAQQTAAQAAQELAVAQARQAELDPSPAFGVARVQRGGRRLGHAAVLPHHHHLRLVGALGVAAGALHVGLERGVAVVGQRVRQQHRHQSVGSLQFQRDIRDRRSVNHRGSQLVWQRCPGRFRSSFWGNLPSVHRWASA